MSEKEEYTEVKLPAKIYRKIEGDVVSLYKKLNITTFPIDPFQIAFMNGYIVKKYSELSEEAVERLRSISKDGISHFFPELRTFIIYYDDSLSYHRVRFTIMHEIGHIILGHREESDLARMMANYFAAYSLVPSPLVGKFECEDYLEVYKRFEVSPDCAFICFQRFSNWSNFGGKLKQYEIELLDLVS